MNRKTKFFITNGLLLLAAVFVTVNAIKASRSLGSLDYYQGWVAHTFQVEDTVDQIMSAISDAESSSRGFLITGEESYLAPFNEATNKTLPKELDDLQVLIADNPVQVSRVPVLRERIYEHINGMKAGIAERRNGSLDTVRSKVLIETGKTEMDRIRELASSMQIEEGRKMNERTTITTRLHSATRWAIILASAIGLVLIFVVSLSLLREQRLRRIAEEARHRLGLMQTISDVALTQLPVVELTAELLKRVRKVVDADATLLATWRGEQLIVDAADGMEALPGTTIAESLDDPLHSAARENRIAVVDYPAGAGIYAGQPTAYRGGGPISGEGFETDDLLREVVGERLRTLLVIPLLASGRVMGVLVAGRRTPDPFVLQDEELLSVVADRISIALDRAKAYEAEREARRLAEENAGQVQKLNGELEIRVSQRTAELETTNKELEAFSYSVSHDLRAPLRTVDGFSAALEEDYAARLDAEGRDFLRRIRDGVQRMGQLIDALLQLSRITRAELSREAVNLTALTQQVAEELRQQNPERQIEFKIQPEMMADADSRLLRVGLENLLGNAVKFTGNQPKAVIEVGQTAETGEFYVRDNGAGFDMKYVDKLFTAFQRLHGEKDFKGSGIGLATVARVIRRHRGLLRAEGEVNKGATFRFTLG